MKDTRVFYSYSDYLKDKYGAKAYRVAVDGGFSCPNRDKDRRRGGCTFCDEVGSRAVYTRDDTAERARGIGCSSVDIRKSWVSEEESLARLDSQVHKGIDFLHTRYKAEILLLYFQAFSSTHAPAAELKRRYDRGLSLAPFRELIVSTRPDCLDEEKADLLASYMTDPADDSGEGIGDVWVELGLQSVHDTTLKRINRGHGIAEFDRSFKMLRERGVKVSIHLIFGLPGEGMDEIMETMQYVSRIRPEGVKIHNLHIPGGSPMFDEYLRGELTVPCSMRHMEYTIRALELLHRDTVIQRMTCDTPRYNLAAPRRFWEKGTFWSRISKEMERRETFQGRLYSADKNISL